MTTKFDELVAKLKENFQIDRILYDTFPSKG